jgi:hypothetical protein
MLVNGANFISSLTSDLFLESKYKLWGTDYDEEDNVVALLLEIVNSSTFIIITKNIKHASFINAFDGRYDYRQLTCLVMDMDYDYKYYKDDDQLFICTDDDYWCIFNEKHLQCSEDSDDDFKYTGKNVKFSAFFGEQCMEPPTDIFLEYVGIPFDDIEPLSFDKLKLDDGYQFKWKDDYTVTLPGEGGCIVYKDGAVLCTVTDDAINTQIGDCDTEIFMYKNSLIVCNGGDVSSYSIIELID